MYLQFLIFFLPQAYMWNGKEFDLFNLAQNISWKTDNF